MDRWQCPIDYVTCDIIPRRMRMHQSNIMVLCLVVCALIMLSLVRVHVFKTSALLHRHLESVIQAY